MPKTTLNIDVLGCSIPISAEEDHQYLSRLLEIYKIKISEMKIATRLSDPLKIAILTGFMLCDEGEKLRSGKPHIEINSMEEGEREDGSDGENTFPGAANTDENNEAVKLTLSLISQLDDILNPVNIKNQWIYKLSNTVKNYEWGSPEWIPRLVGEINKKQIPWAELWMGIHPDGPSIVIVPESKDGEETAEQRSVKLGDLITKDPVFFLGEQRARIFKSLPFLFKVLAAEKPLSIQAHPNLAQAKTGWEQENEKGIPINAPERNYKDANHKPEIICALEPFTAMAGFREPRKIKTLLELFLQKAPQSLVAALKPLITALEGQEPLQQFLEQLFMLSPLARQALSAYAREMEAELGLDTVSDYPDEWQLVAQFARLFPDDPAILSPFYLNVIHLYPGEALYLPAGILHAYVHGLGVELMANSNNVLRGGLTSKHVDIPELLQILDFSTFRPDILKPAGNMAGEYEYPVPCKEFSLSTIQGGDIVYLETGPSIILVTRGELKITGPEEELILKQGESAFIPAGQSGLKFSGAYTVYAAGTGPVPDTENPQTDNTQTIDA